MQPQVNTEITPEARLNQKLNFPYEVMENGVKALDEVKRQIVTIY